MPPLSPPSPAALAALLATLAALLATLARASPAHASTADAPPPWPALRPACASATPRSSSAPNLRSRSPPGRAGILGCGHWGGMGKRARPGRVPRRT
jgi:hypothetical protein